VIHGTHDRLLPCEAAIEVAQRVAGAKLWLLPEAGHAQEPALMADEEYAAQLAEFFAGRADSPPERGAVLEALDGGTKLELGRRWRVGREPPVETGTAGPRWTLRIHRALPDGRGGWEASPSARSRVFRGGVGAKLQALTRHLHRLDAGPALDELEALAAIQPPFPFNHIARLHAARLEQLAARRQRKIAARAARIFEALAPAPDGERV
jgi:hypothetical protein